MCAAILVFVGGLVLAASTQAAPLAHVPTRSSLIRPRPSDWCSLAAGGAGVGTIGETASRLRKKSRFRKNGHEMSSMPDYGHIRSMGYGLAPVGESQRNDDQSTFSAAC
jgi:hypothetical protein